MKKLLVCMLVLGMTCVANAGLEYMVDGAAVTPSAEVAVPAGAVPVVIGNEVAETGVFQGGFVQVTGAGSVAEGLLVNENLPGAWTIANLGPNDLGKGEADLWYMEWTTPAVDAFGAGPLAQFSVMFEGPRAVFDFYDLELSPVASITLVPEPMTMALLGLGGLFLRRRMA